MACCHVATIRSVLAYQRKRPGQLTGDSVTDQLGKRLRSSTTTREIGWLRTAVGRYLVTMTGVDVRDDKTAEACRSAVSYLKRFSSATVRQKPQLAKSAPLDDLHAAALHYADPFTRRACVFFLDHYANEASTAVFTEALHDPVDFVRNAALHSIACESCRTEELCVADVVPSIVSILEDDPSPELRTKAVPTLLRLAGRDSRARDAIERAAEHDPDRIVRQAATDALGGNFVAPRKRYERRQRRQDRRSPPS
jgi:HEAT repeats